MVDIVAYSSFEGQEVLFFYGIYFCRGNTSKIFQKDTHATLSINPRPKETLHKRHQL